MLKNNYQKVILTCLVFGAFVIFEKWKHRFDRPWAYAGDQVLMGKWEGDFKDPKGISKHIEMEILEPEDEINTETYIPQKIS